MANKKLKNKHKQKNKPVETPPPVVEDSDEDEDEDEDVDDEEDDEDEGGESEETPEAKADGKKKAKRKNKPRQPWKDRQIKRLERCVKGLTKLAKILVAAKPPGVDVAAADAAHKSMTARLEEVKQVPQEWKPARGTGPGTADKPGIGDIIAVDGELEGDDLKVYKHIPQKLFAGAKILDNDGRDNWLVRCQDGMVRSLRRKHAVHVEK